MAFCCVTSAVSRCAVGGRSVPFSPGKRDTYWLCRTRTAFQRYAFSENTRRGVCFFCVEMTIVLYFAKCRWRSGVIFVQIVLPVAFPVLHVPRFSMPLPPCRCPLSSVGKSLFRAFSQKRGTLSRNTGSFRVFIAGSRAPTYAHSAGFRFLPSLFVCYRLIFSALWVKIVVFSLVHRFTTERVHCAGERKWSVGASSSPSHELRGTVARGEGKGEGEFQKSSPLTG